MGVFAKPGIHALQEKGIGDFPHGQACFVQYRDDTLVRLFYQIDDDLIVKIFNLSKEGRGAAWQGKVKQIFFFQTWLL